MIKIKIHDLKCGDLISTDRSPSIPAIIREITYEDGNAKIKFVGWQGQYRFYDDSVITKFN